MMEEMDILYLQGRMEKLRSDILVQNVGNGDKVVTKAESDLHHLPLEDNIEVI